MPHEVFAIRSQPAFTHEMNVVGKEIADAHDLIAKKNGSVVASYVLRAASTDSRRSTADILYIVADIPEPMDMNVARGDDSIVDEG